MLVFGLDATTNSVVVHRGTVERKFTFYDSEWVDVDCGVDTKKAAVKKTLHAQSVYRAPVFGTVSRFSAHTRAFCPSEPLDVTNQELIYVDITRVCETCCLVRHVNGGETLWIEASTMLHDIFGSSMHSSLTSGAPSRDEAVDFGDDHIDQRERTGNRSENLQSQPEKEDCSFSEGSVPSEWNRLFGGNIPAVNEIFDSSMPSALFVAAGTISGSSDDFPDEGVLSL